MWLLTFLLLIQFPNPATGQCKPSVSVPMDTVLSGKSFSLTCYFTCLNVDHRVLSLLKNYQEWIDLSLSSTWPASMHNITMSVHVTAAGPSDSGIYQCKSKDIFSPYVKVNVTAHREQLGEHRLVRSETSSSSTCLESKHNITLYVYLPEVKQNGSGWDQGDTVSASPLKVNETDVCCPSHIMKSEINSACCDPQSWALLHAPVWYLLCKAAVFLVYSLSEFLKATRQAP